MARAFFKIIIWDEITVLERLLVLFCYYSRNCPNPYRDKPYPLFGLPRVMEDKGILHTLLRKGVWLMRASGIHIRGTSIIYYIASKGKLVLQRALAHSTACYNIEWGAPTHLCTAHSGGGGGTNHSFIRRGCKVQSAKCKQAGEICMGAKRRKKHSRKTALLASTCPLACFVHHFWCYAELISSLQRKVHARCFRFVLS